MSKISPDRSATSGWIEHDIHHLPIRVYYEDTDFSGRVYHASYLRFCERGRSELLRHYGYSHLDLAKEKNTSSVLFFAVHHMDINFLASAEIDNVLTVHSQFTGSSGARLFINQNISNGDDPVLRANVTVVSLDSNGRPCRLPTKLRSIQLNAFS